MAQESRRPARVRAREIVREALHDRGGVPRHQGRPLRDGTEGDPREECRAARPTAAHRRPRPNTSAQRSTGKSSTMPWRVRVTARGTRRRTARRCARTCSACVRQCPEMSSLLSGYAVRASRGGDAAISAGVDQWAPTSPHARLDPSATGPVGSSVSRLRTESARPPRLHPQSRRPAGRSPASSWRSAPLIQCRIQASKSQGGSGAG
jgi:hypothetical protein